MVVLAWVASSLVAPAVVVPAMVAFPLEAPAIDSVQHLVPAPIFLYVYISCILYVTTS